MTNLPQLIADALAPPEHDGTEFMNGRRVQHARTTKLTALMPQAITALIDSACGCKLQLEGTSKIKTLQFFGGTEIAICDRCDVLRRIRQALGEG